MKVLVLTSVFLLFLFSSSSAQYVETLISHPKIVDGLFVDELGNVFTTSGGLTNGTEIGKYDVQTDIYDPNFAIGFSGPINIAKYRDSLFIVSNYDNSTVYSYHLNSGVINTIATGLDGPAGLVVDSNDNIYISNWGQAPAWAGHQIHKISSSGIVTVYIDSSVLYRPQAITINHLDELIVHSQQNLYKVNPIDSSLSLWVNVGHYLGNITFREADSCIYGASNQGHKIVKINAQGIVSVFSGSTQGYQDGAVDTALFNIPLGIAFSPTEDTLYVGESGNVNRLRRIIMDTEFTSIFELESNDLLVYPNPSNGVYKVKTKSTETANLEVFNSVGELVLHKTKNSKTTIIDLSRHPSGIYTIKVMIGNKVLIKNIVKT